VIKPENILDGDKLRELCEAYSYSYEGGRFPEDIPEWIEKFTEGDGGVLHLIDLANHYLAQRDEAIKLLEYAMHLRMNGECAPGGNETWREFDTRNETFLRAVWGDEE
jgi:hypothetical protein